MEQKTLGQEQEKITLLDLVKEDNFTIAWESSSRDGQFNGPCPFPGCGGTDRFRVQPYHGRYGWFACNQCGRKGTAIDYLMQKRGFSKGKALHIVGWTPSGEDEETLEIPAYIQRGEYPKWNEPPSCWQETARAFIHYCCDVLWSPEGQQALAYLQQRGLTEQTIKGEPG